MMNKKLSLVLLALLSFTLVFAENETVEPELISANEVEAVAISAEEIVSTETEELVDTMNIPEGVMLRFSQLERQISIKIDRGELVVSRIENLNESHNVSELNAILEELALIKDEVSFYTFEGNISSVREATIAFVDLKKESLDLVKDFREIVRSLLSEEEIESLRPDVEEINEEDYEEMGERIRNRIREVNSNRVRTALQNMNVENNTLVQEVLDGNISYGQIKQRIRNAYQNLGQAIRNAAVVRIRQNLTQEDVNIASVVEEAVSNHSERVVERLQRRIEQVETRNTRAISNIQRVTARITDRIATRTNTASASNGNNSGGNNE